MRPSSPEDKSPRNSYHVKFNDVHHQRKLSPEEVEVAKNDELLSLLIGEKQETTAQKRERQRKYREDLERQKRINEFYIKNLNPE
jgi:hypothetical protein